MSITVEDTFNHEQARRIWEMYEDPEECNTPKVRFPHTIMNDGEHGYQKTKTVYVDKINKFGRHIRCRKEVPKTFSENIYIKHYIKVGEECPICYEQIWHRKNAYLTICGHSFHKSCLYTFWFKNIHQDFSCPMCRTDEGGEVWEDDFIRYREIDKYVENRELLRPAFCTKEDNDFNDIVPHVCGTKKKCKVCTNYINHGEKPFDAVSTTVSNPLY